MADIIFLTVPDLIEMHENQIATHGGDSGTHDLGLLKSAVEMPAMQSFGQYLHPTLFDMAAAYCFHLAKNHAFKDGNKRIASVAAETFLLLNGYDLDVGEPDHSQMVLAVADGSASKADAAAFYERQSRPQAAPNA